MNPTRLCERHLYVAGAMAQKACFARLHQIAATLS
jgi:hypothetical protein